MRPVWKGMVTPGTILGALLVLALGFAYVIYSAVVFQNRHGTPPARVNELPRR